MVFVFDCELVFGNLINDFVVGVVFDEDCGWGGVVGWDEIECGLYIGEVV